MHLVFSDVFCFYRPKRRRAHMKSNENGWKSSQNLRREMQSSRRGGERAIVFRKHGLITRFVFFAEAAIAACTERSRSDRRPFDVRRQRNRAAMKKIDVFI